MLIKHNNQLINLPESQCFVTKIKKNEDKTSTVLFEFPDESFVFVPLDKDADPHHFIELIAMAWELGKKAIWVTDQTLEETRSAMLEEWMDNG